MKNRSHRGQQSKAGFTLIEVLAYIVVLFVVMGVGYMSVYRSIDHSVALRKASEDITTAMGVGETWRSDVRRADKKIWSEVRGGESILHLERTDGDVVYRFADGAMFRKSGAGSWVKVLPNVKSSAMNLDKRNHFTAWKWELELQPRTIGTVKPGRVVPLFTFLAVPPATTAL